AGPDGAHARRRRVRRRASRPDGRRACARRARRCGAGGPEYRPPSRRSPGGARRAGGVPLRRSRPDPGGPGGRPSPAARPRGAGGSCSPRGKGPIASRPNVGCGPGTHGGCGRRGRAIGAPRAPPRSRRCGRRGAGARRRPGRPTRWRGIARRPGFGAGPTARSNSAPLCTGSAMCEEVRVLAVPGTVPADAVRAVARALPGAAPSGAALPGHEAAADVERYAEAGGAAVTVVVVPAAVSIGVDELELIAASGAPPSSVVLVAAGPPGRLPLHDAVESRRRVLAEFAPGYERCAVLSGGTGAARLREAVEQARRTAAGGDPVAELAECRSAAELARARRARELRRAESRRIIGALRARRDGLVRRRAGLDR